MDKVLMALLGGLFAVFTQHYGGEIEGRLFPVMGPLSIEDPRPMEPPSYRNAWRGEARKARDCSFVRLEWFYGPRYGRRVQVEVEFTDPPTLRGPGQTGWAGIVISLEPEAVRNNSHADAIHHCPWRPWYTRTAFYDGAGH